MAERRFAISTSPCGPRRIFRPILSGPGQGFCRSDADNSIALLRPSTDRGIELLFFEWVTANAADVRPVANVVMHMRDARFVRANDIDQHLIERLVSDQRFDAARTHQPKVRNRRPEGVLRRSRISTTRPRTILG